ncbi:MAG: prepilin-type N-terminal cleavage/methylation domain-containing protein [Nitrospiraceae bacterium]|nr:MAG: prepilin-type N-terminal cleavage/methylation domain-containing protein [Nitrospiraceae bacterium]
MKTGIENRENSGNTPGFTLLEILISITLLVIVLGAAYSSFFSVQRALERFDSVSLKYHEARTALDIMRREIEGALVRNPRSTDENSKDKASFVIKDRDVLGKNTSALELTAFTFKGSNLSKVSYFVGEKEGRLDLLKKEAPAGIQSKDYTMEIIEGIESFSVETLFNNKWVKTWDTADTAKLPDILRLSIEFDDNGRKVKLTEYAKPRVGRTL